MKNLIVLASLLASFSTFASNIYSGDFYPNNAAKCGWHVEIDGNTIVLEAKYSSTQACDDYLVLVGTCNHRTSVCTLEETNEKVIFLSDGNMIFKNNKGVNYKNYLNIR